MAQAIDIPSPSVFLRKSPPLTDPPPEQERPPSRKNAPQAKRQNSATQAKKKAARKSLSGGAPDGGSGGDGVQKPKQSKSRNGKCLTFSRCGSSTLRVQVLLIEETANTNNAA